MKKLFISFIALTSLFATMIITSCSDKNEDKFQIIEFECTYEMDDMAKELLVFIVHDVFELITILNGETCVIQCKINSKQMKATLETLNIVSVAKAFPDWPEEVVIVYNEFGQPITKPEFNRLFKFLFISEQEADNAITKLNALPEVAYAEKNGSVGFL